MKKTIMFLGVLSLGLAQAQQEGKVGINTEAPKATLEIQPTATNLAGTTNEGIVAPKLSKTRVAGIAEPVEGTLVYVTDEAASTIASYTGNDVKVAKIDEKGYYFFDGTEWVKTKSNLQDQEWVYDSATKQIKLKRSGQTQGFVNKVYYNAETGQFMNKEVDQIDTTAGVEILDGKGVFNLSQRNSSSILPSIRANGNHSKKLAHNILNIDEKNAIDNFVLSAQDNAVLFAKSNKTPAHWVNAGGNTMIKLDETATQYAVAGQNSTNIFSGNITGYAIGTRSSVNINNPKGEIEAVYGSSALVSLGDVKRIGALSGTTSYIALASNNIQEKIGRIALFDANVAFYKGINPKIDELVGYYYGGAGSEEAKITNTKVHYGLYLGNIVKAQDNYAIYTNFGKNSFGDVTKIASTVYAPLSTLTVQGMASIGDNTTTYNRSIFTGLAGGKNPVGHFVGFGAYPDNKEGKFYATADYQATAKSRFIIFNNANSDGNKVHFSPFMLTNALQKQEFDPVAESALTIISQSKHIGVGTNEPKQKLDVAGGIKIANTDTCDNETRGTIRFVNDKFQGCTSTGWKDLHQ